MEQNTLQIFEVYFAEWDGVFLLDGNEPAADLSEWAELFRGIPAPSSAAFYGLCRFCEAHPAAVNAALPWLAAEIGSNDGYMTMLQFVHRWGGLRLYVSKDHGQFVEKVGCDLCESTHQRFIRDAGVGSQVEVPSAWGVFLALRRVAIAIAIRSRMPHDEITRRFGVTMRSLR